MLIIDIGALLVLPVMVMLITRNGIVTILTLLFVTVFMYSPDKLNSQSYADNIFYSPSAGYIQTITEDAEYIHITLFLNLFDNHTQYFPVDSVLLQTKKIPGLFEPAYMEHSINNEKMEHTLQSTHHGFFYKITQITGLLTRRILVIAEKGNGKAGSRLGFIVLGSRVDITIPQRNVEKVLVQPKSHIQEMTGMFKLLSTN